MSDPSGSILRALLQCSWAWKDAEMEMLNRWGCISSISADSGAGLWRPRRRRRRGGWPGLLGGSGRPMIPPFGFGSCKDLAMEEEKEEKREEVQPGFFFQQLPKVELHAHLNGSISSDTMKKLLAQKPDLRMNNGKTMIDKGKKRSLEECFQMFQIIHQITNRTEDILMVTKEVVREFAADGVKYLELRSTPRDEPATGMTKRTYIEAVLEGIRQCREEEVDIDVRFLVSVDRRGGPTVAKETVKLAEEFLLSTDGVVVGLDLSGNPTAGHGRDFLEPLLEARKAGLMLALHLSEIPNQEEETRLLLGLPPDRIGHGTFLHSPSPSSPDLVQLVRKNRTPLELCLTSNLKGQTVPSSDQHHFGFWYNMCHPLVLCTDDKGVFATDLSQEYQLVAETFQLSEEQIWDLSYGAIDHIFASGHTKAKLKERWHEMKPSLFK